MGRGKHKRDGLHRYSIWAKRLEHKRPPPRHKTSQSPRWLHRKQERGRG